MLFPHLIMLFRGRRFMEIHWGRLMATFESLHQPARAQASGETAAERERPVQQAGSPEDAPSSEELLQEVRSRLDYAVQTPIPGPLAAVLLLDLAASALDQMDRKDRHRATAAREHAEREREKANALTLQACERQLTTFLQALRMELKRLDTEKQLDIVGPASGDKGPPLHYSRRQASAVLRVFRKTAEADRDENEAPLIELWVQKGDQGISLLGPDYRCDPDEPYSVAGFAFLSKDRPSLGQQQLLNICTYCNEKLRYVAASVPTGHVPPREGLQSRL